MVDHSVSTPAWQLAVGLLGAFRAFVDEAHVHLAAAGHPDARPVHGFALQAIGAGAIVTEVGERLGVSKQAAARTVWMLEQQGYVARQADAHDARRRVIVPTERGRALLDDSVWAFEEVAAQWRDRIGIEAVDGLLAALLSLDVLGSAKLDLSTWSS